MTFVMSTEERHRIVAVNLSKRQAMFGDDHLCDITMLDMDGDETDDPEEAIAFVAGPTSDGKWVTDEVDTFDYDRRVH